MKKMQIVRVNSSDGELHFIFNESEIETISFENEEEIISASSKAEAIDITKKEAQKPLLIAREA